MVHQRIGRTVGAVVITLSWAAVGRAVNNYIFNAPPSAIGQYNWLGASNWYLEAVGASGVPNTLLESAEFQQYPGSQVNESTSVGLGASFPLHSIKSKALFNIGVSSNTPDVTLTIDPGNAGIVALDVTASELSFRATSTDNAGDLSVVVNGLTEIEGRMTIGSRTDFAALGVTVLDGSLTIEDGTYASTTLTAGHGSGDLGEVYVLRGGTLNLADDLTIGRAGESRLSIQSEDDLFDDSVVNSVDTFVGLQPGAVGEIEVGPQGRWFNSGDVYLGGSDLANGGEGTLRLNGTYFATQYPAMAEIGGNLELRDGLISLFTGAELTVGGQLETRSGTQLVMQHDAVLRVNANLLDLAGGSFDWIEGQIHFTSKFNVDSTVSHAPLGNAVTLDAGEETPFSETWVQSIVVDGELGVGTGAGGSLEVAGGYANSVSGRIGGNGVALQPSRATVDGGESIWAMSQDLTIGTLPANPEARLEILNSGTVSMRNAFIGISGLKGDVTISGAGSALASTDSVYLGGNASLGGGQGTLALTNNGTLAVGNSASDQLVVWNGYAVTMNQSAINTRNLVVRGSIAPAAGAFIPGHISVAGTTDLDGGTLTLSALSSNLVASGNVIVQNGGALNAYIHGGIGTNVVVFGIGSTWTTPNVVASVLGSSTTGVGRIRSLTLNAGGTANLTAGVSFAAGASDGLQMGGGTLNAPTFNAGTVGVSGRGTINASYSGSGQISPNGALTIGNASSPVGFATTGSISVFGNSLTLNDADAVELGPTTTLGIISTGGALIAPNGINLAPGETISGFGSVQTDNNAADRLQNLGAINGASTTNRITLAGYVTGNGSFTNVEFTGTLEPSGALPSIRTGLVSGSNYKFTSSSELLMDIGGANPGFGYDIIFSTGQFIADGALKVSLINGFTPSIGQTFDLLDFGTLIGTFDVLVLPLLNPGLGWDVSQLYTQGRITVAAELLKADFEQDGDVDANDLARWQNGFGIQVSAAHDEGDADANGAVNGADFLIWQRQYTGPLAMVAEITVVPEPSAWWLSALSMIFPITGRYKRCARPSLRLLTPRPCRLL